MLLDYLDIVKKKNSVFHYLGYLDIFVYVKSRLIEALQ